MNKEENVHFGFVDTRVCAGESVQDSTAMTVRDISS